ncbi:hypothetical protein SCHPADRAFT_944661 [Schizopora paradoxa]|uniref:Uncharacterized protein n=1 Tax=Schizopora paradoxa TaxID=27342 RepID=A0A0H2R8M5_9AGAM|nr:hypothetical protein SCHPADRAFT_944661 [Schizopora paradoxa]
MNLVGILWVASVLYTPVASRASSVPHLRQKRDVVSNATCLGVFSWMSNSKGQDPCLVSAWLLSQCASGSWFIPKLPNASFLYGFGGSGSGDPNVCACSWAVYNTLQACAFCQGIEFGLSIITWVEYNDSCKADQITEGPWPPNVIIPIETSIPFWAEENPDFWPNSRFDPTSAQTLLAAQGKPDLSQADRVFKSRPLRKGAIIGGALGGAFLVILGLECYFWRCRRIKRKALEGTLAVPAYLRSLDSIDQPEDIAIPITSDNNLNTGSTSKQNPVSREILGQPFVANTSYPTKTRPPRIPRLPSGASQPEHVIQPFVFADPPDLSINPFIVPANENGVDELQHTNLEAPPSRNEEENPPAYSSIIPIG